MINKTNVWTITILAVLTLESWALYVVGSSLAHWRSSMIVKDEPAAHGLYDKMIETIYQAESLSYQSACSGPDERVSTYNILLKKPDYFCIGAMNTPSARYNSFVGDGDNLWFYWSGIRPCYAQEDRESYEKTRSKAYIKKEFMTAGYSIKEQINTLGTVWYGTILDPSIFHGYTDSLAPYIDGIRSRGKDYIGDEECEIIEVSFMKAQRNRYFWISKKDYLPRKIKDIVRPANVKIMVEELSDIKLNDRIQKQNFTWSPPQGWQQWEKPGPEDILLKPQTKAPDFELISINGNKIKLSDYRGKVIWLYIWQCGTPECREEIPHLQALYEKYRDKGLVILGFNYTDDKKIAKKFIRENSVTFPIIFDSTDIAEKVITDGYKKINETVPLSYIIDTQGNVVDAWYGYNDDHKRASAALKKAGIQLRTTYSDFRN
ncbi:MAG: redoxin domain-containing protein [Sedimentisphaerales bacterium]|nr:redoxin domain-containing protein [Sedimentisphaerales bacterium]